MADDKATKLLTRWISMDLKPMTARVLARELSVHVHEAQRLLEAHAKAHPDLAATYRLSGVPRLKAPESKAAKTEDGAAGPGLMDVDASAGEASSSSSSSLRAPVAPAEVERRKVVVCPSSQLEARKAIFDPSTLSLSVYSLSPSPLPTPAALVPTLTALTSHPAYLAPATYGSAQCPSMRMLKGAEARLKAGQLADRKAIDRAKEAEKGKGKAGKEEEKKGPVKKPGTLDWSKARPAAATEKEKPKPAPKKRDPPAPQKGSTTGTKTRATLSDSDDDDDVPAKSKPPPPVSIARPAPAVEKKKEAPVPPPAAVGSKEERERIAKQKADLAGLFDMDADEVPGGGSRDKGKRKSTALSDDDNDEVENRSNPPSPPPAKKPTAASKKKAAPAAAAGSKASVKGRSASPVKSAGEGGGNGENAVEEVRNAEGKLRRTRRVVRSEMVVNKRGYMVTEDVSDVESYYTDDDSPAAAAPAKSKKPTAPSRTSSSSSTTTTAGAGALATAGEGKRKPAPATKKAGGSATVGKGGQTSMKSFFGKK